jgi:hypothetical protein
MNGTIYTGFGNEWHRNHITSPSNSEVPICERSCHIQRKTEIKPCTAINNMDLRQINIFCEIFKIYNVVFFLCSFTCCFIWRKQLNNCTDPLAQPHGPPGVRRPPFEKHCGLPSYCWSGVSPFFYLKTKEDPYFETQWFFKVLGFLCP